MDYLTSKNVEELLAPYARSEARVERVEPLRFD
jgi:hypothetical protein